MIIFTNPPLLHCNVHHSVMTTSVARDHIPSNVAILSNHMFIFVLTKSDGTLFEASSILEEDVIEIWIWFGHTHPEGVLWYSVMESVMLFHMVDKLQITACKVMKASMLWVEAIRVRTSPMSATHVQAYIVVANGEHLAPILCPTMGRRNPILPLTTPILVGEPHNTCKKTLGILQMMSCNSSWRISAGRSHSESWTHSQEPPTNTLGNPVGNEHPDADDWEVTFQKREGGFPQSNHFDLLLLHNQMQGGIPEDNLLTPSTCLTQ